MSAEPEKPSSSSEQKHLLRTSTAFGKTVKSFSEAAGFQVIQGGYWGHIADEARKIIIAKQKSGELKKKKRRGGAPKLAIFLIALIGVLCFSVVFAQWSGQFTATTTVRSPVYMANSQIVLSDIWLNTSRSIISDNALILNTAGRTITYQFGLYGTLTFSNGSQTQDLSRIFSNFRVVISDYQQNMTVTNLIGAASQPVSFAPFTYSASGDHQCRIIMSYAAKPVNLGGTTAQLTLNFLYSFSGQ